MLYLTGIYFDHVNVREDGFGVSPCWLNLSQHFVTQQKRKGLIMLKKTIWIALNIFQKTAICAY